MFTNIRWPVIKLSEIEPWPLTELLQTVLFFMFIWQGNVACGYNWQFLYGKNCQYMYQKLFKIISCFIS